MAPCVRASLPDGLIDNSQLPGVRRPVGAFSLLRPVAAFYFRRRQAGADQSGDKSPHSRELLLTYRRVMSDARGA
jgi:hypothetical protein